MVKTRTFKSGNSVAVRLPKTLGVEAGLEVSVREERGRYIIEPVEKGGGKVDLGDIYGSVPAIEQIERESDDYEDLPRDWHLLGLDPR